MWWVDRLVEARVAESVLPEEASVDWAARDLLAGSCDRAYRGGADVEGAIHVLVAEEAGGEERWDVRERRGRGLFGDQQRHL